MQKIDFLRAAIDLGKYVELSLVDEAAKRLP